MEGMEGVCGLNECIGSWAEALLVLVVVIGELRGARWDAGYVQKWVDALAEESIRKEREVKGKIIEEWAEAMEKGEGEKELEKGGLELKQEGQFGEKEMRE